MSSKESTPDLDTDIISITVKSEARKIQAKVSKLDVVSVIKQYLVDLASSNQPSTCFSLYFDNEKLGLDQIIGETDLSEGSVIELRPDEYSESESLLHVKRTKDLFGFSRVYPTPIVDPGLTAFPDVEAKVLETVPKNTEEKQKIEGPHPLLAYEKDFAAETRKNSRYTNGRDVSIATPAVKALQLSQWNPVPPQFQWKGDLFYLYLVTLENKTFHITSNIDGYYVSNCTSEKFDPSPRKVNGKLHQNHSLISLVTSLSPLALKQLHINSEYVKSLDPLSLIGASNTFLATPWLVADRTACHWTADMTRTQSAFSSGGGLRDWNEDLQTARQKPSADENGAVGLQDRLLRERLLNKLGFDFCEAAVKGAINIIRGNVAALNPEEEKGAQIFLHEGIFYSYGSDGVGSFALDGGNAAARYSVGKDLSAVNVINSWDVDGMHTLWTVIVDYCGRRVVCQSPVPGIFSETESGANRIVYGGVDNRETIAADEEYLPLMETIASHCHLKTHKVYSNSGAFATLATSVETKGLTGTDGRKYVLDLYRITPLDLVFIEQNFKEGVSDSYPHRVPVLRNEAIDIWFREKVQEKLSERSKTLAEKDDEKSKEEEDKKTQQTEEEKEAEAEAERKAQEALINELSETWKLNPDVGPNDEALIPESEIGLFRKDQEEVRQVCRYIQEKLAPEFVADVKNGALLTPVDGTVLTTVLHSKGINLRYIGLLHSLAKKSGAALGAFSLLLEQEAVARSVKHLINNLIAELSGARATKEIVKFIKGMFAGDSSVHSKVSQETFVRFRLALDAEFWERSANFTALFREISIKLGLQWKNKKYIFSNLSAIEEEDLVNIAPIIRATNFKSRLAEDAYEAGRVCVQRGDKETGLELLSESLSLYEQVYGIIHPEVSRAYIKAAMFYNEVTDYKSACDLCRRSLIISERTLGIDAGETIFSYLNLSLFEYYRGNCLGGLQVLRTLLNNYYLFVGQLANPHVLTIITNTGAMLQSLEEYESSLKWFEFSLKNVLTIYGKDSVATASAYYQVAQSLIRLKDYHKATNSMQLAHSIFLNVYGPEDDNTKDCKKWLESLVEAAVSVAKMQKAQPALARMAQESKPATTTNFAAQSRDKRQKSYENSKGSLGDEDINDLVSYINGSGGAKPKKKNKKKNNQ